jgi:methylase of polypeptide subunit release factors
MPQLIPIQAQQAAAVNQLLQQTGFIEIQTGQDLAGLDRWVQGRKPL